jgi:hypothetical protein
MELIGILVAYPWLALAVAGLLVILWRWSHSKVALVVAVFWAGYAGYEYLMLKRVLCTGECNIRVDLLLIYPLLLIGILAAVIHSVWARNANRRAA